MIEPIDKFIPRHKGDELPEAVALLPRGDLLLPYQQRAALQASTSPLLVIEKSRRIGLTWGMASNAVLTAGSARGEGGDDFSYISYSQEMTREFIDACAMWAKAFAIVGSAVDEFLFEDQDEHGNTKSIKAFRISFASGFEIVALSSAPRSLRGRKGVVFIDEAAFVDNLAELLKAALALLMWGGRVIVVSTHNGVDNPFNQLLDEIRSGRRKGDVMKITLADAIADGLYERICLVTGKEATPAGRRAWEADVRASYAEAAAEELDCIPAAGGGAFIDPALVIAAHHDDCAKPEMYQKGLCVAGRDIARRRDLDVIWVFEMIGNVLWLRLRSEARNTKLTLRQKIFSGLFRVFRIFRAMVDETGMGMGEVERAQEEFGEVVVVGVTFTAANKLDIALAMKKRFEDGTIRIFVDPEVRADFRAIKVSKGAGETVRLVNDTEEVHADMFWACALACKAADLGEPAYYGYKAAPKRDKFSDVPRGHERDRGLAPGRMRNRPDDRGAGARFRKGTTW
jgi:phage FluMu gp28-like protein